MVMCCPKCKGVLYPKSEQVWKCESCDWTGSYPMLNQEKINELKETLRESNSLRHLQNSDNR